MAIERYGVDNDLELLKVAIDAAAIFGSTEVSGDVLTINDTEGEARIKITKESATSWTFSVKLATGVWYNNTTVTGVEINYAWICNGGIFVNMQGSGSNYAPAILTTTNTGAYALIVTANNSYYKNAGIVAVSNDDTDGSQLNVFDFPRASRSYTTMIPFTTETGGGAVSYTPAAFYMPFASVNEGTYTRVVLDGKLYITEGYWAVLDGDL